MVCPPPVMPSLPLRIVPTIGYGTLKGLVAYLIQNDCTGTSSTNALLTCCALGSLEKFASDQTANWICNERYKGRGRALSLEKKEMIHLISELGCKIIVWGMASGIGFTPLPVTLTTSAITGSITLARRLDSVLYYSSKEIDNLGRFIIAWNPIFTISLVALGNLSRAYSSHFCPFTTGLVLFTTTVYLINAFAINVINDDQNRLKTS